MKKCAVVIVTLCLLLCLGGCGKGGLYKKAEKLLEESSFSQAQEMFSMLGDYDDAAERSHESQYLHVKSLLEADNPDYAQAVRLLREIGAYKDALALKAELQEKYYFAEYGYRIPALECIVPDTKRTEERGKDDAGAYHRYTYTWRVSDMAAARELSDRFMKWIDCIHDEDGVDAQPYRGGAYFISVDDVPYGLVSSHKTDNTVSVTAMLYDEPMEN